MKTTSINLLAGMIPPTALLLSHCAPVGGIQPEVGGVTIPTEPNRRQVAFQPGMLPLTGNPFRGVLTAHSEDEPRRITPGDSSANETDVIQLTPVVVTDTTKLPDTTANRPANVIKAEWQVQWVFLNQSGPPTRYVLEDSFLTWIESIRR